MKSRKLALLALLCLASTTIFAQDLGGTWQGTLSVQGNSLRVVFQVTKAGDGRFTGQGFSIDQGGQAIPMSAITVDGRTVKWKLDREKFIDSLVHDAQSNDRTGVEGGLFTIQPPKE